MRIPRYIYVGTPQGPQAQAGGAPPVQQPPAGGPPVVQVVYAGTEQGHLLGSAEGTWWTRFAWWVIPIGALLLFGGLYTALVRDDVQPTPTPPATRQEIRRRPTPPSPPAEVKVEIPGLRETAADLKSAAEKLAAATIPTASSATQTMQSSVNFPSRIEVEVYERQSEPESDPDPCAGMTAKECRQYRIWVLRK